MFRDKTAVTKDTPIKGVRMGAGERSYLVRDNQIDVLKNMYGGVQVRTLLAHALLLGSSRFHIYNAEHR